MWASGAGAIAVCATACGPPRAAPPLPSVTTTQPVTFKPVSFAILQDYDKGTSLDSVARDFALIRTLGADTWRGSFGWDDYEPARDSFDFAWLHRFADTGGRAGITLRPYIDYTPAWAANGGSGDRRDWNDPPRSLDDWYRFMFRLAGELGRHRNVVSYEIYNEENASLWWDGTLERYAAVLERAARAVRAANPRARVFAGGLVTPDADWAEASCDALRGALSDSLHDGRSNPPGGYANNGAPVVAVPLHAYPETWTPESVTVERYLDAGYRNRFLPVVRSSCDGAPVWLNEVGYATSRDHSERDQAAWWARAIATFLADSAVEEIGIYQLHDQRPSAEVIGESENRHLGLVRLDGTPKLAFHTVRLLLQLLNVGRIGVVDDAVTATVIAGAAGRLHAHLFVRPDGRRVLLVWDESGRPTVQLRVASSARRGTDSAGGGAGRAVATEYALDGTGTAYPRFDGTTLDGVQLVAGVPRIFIF